MLCQVDDSRLKLIVVIGDNGNRWSDRFYVGTDVSEDEIKDDLGEFTFVGTFSRGASIFTKQYSDMGLYCDAVSERDKRYVGVVDKD